MTKKIFRSIVLVAVCALLASLLLIMGCLYDYFMGLQSQALRDELTFAASGVSQSGEGYLDTLSSSQYRLTWIAADGMVLYDTQADAASMENHASREEFQQALATGEGESSRYSQTLLEKTIYVAKRLPDGTVLRISVLRQTLAVLLLGMLQPVLVVALADMDTLLPVLVDTDDDVPQVVSQTKMNDQVTGFVHQVMHLPIALGSFDANVFAVSFASKFGYLLVVVLIEAL